MPELTTQLSYSNKGAGRLPWKKGSFSLKALGIYSHTQSKVHTHTHTHTVQPVIFEGEKFHEFHEFLQLHENIIREKRWAL